MCFLGDFKVPRKFFEEKERKFAIENIIALNLFLATTLFRDNVLFLPL